ncbi:FAD-binding protein [Pararhizobium gei]|uniref:FAD-binding protein n=1 Tax=Pararhizobium gei TaxID=1395951 RepID=UPI0023DAF8E5|nr:FAD-binding protein [Rhizobium gei]
MIPIFEPETEAEAASIIATVARNGLTLTLQGGGTRSGLGNPVQADRVLSARKLSGIVSYVPAEMTMTAKAGTPMAEIEAALSENRQMLAFEPIDHRGIMGTPGEPTIGGVFATNASGPRRITAGAARDHLLGIRFVNGAGEIIRSGGKVMKNVTGLDLVKLLCGAHGTLGLLTEVTFKVLPLPPAAATLALSGLDDAEASKVMASAMALPVEVCGAAHLPESVRSRFLDGALPDGPATVLRIEGLAASVDVRSEKLRAAFAANGRITTLDHDATTRLWREIRDIRPYADATEKPLWRVSVAPSAGHRLVAALRLEAGVDAFYDWQGGLVWLRMEADPEADLIRRYIKHLGGGHATLMRAPETLRPLTPAFEPQAPAIAALSERVRQKFDAKRIFNPGKMG